MNSGMLRLYLQEYDPQDRQHLAELCRSSLEFEWDSRVQVCTATLEELLTQIQGDDLPALFVLADSAREELHLAVKRIREGNALHYLVLLLSSLEDVLRVRPPYYRPAGFLLRPVERMVLTALLSSIYEDFREGMSGSGAVFHAKVRGTAYPVPYDKIIFFESRSKKVILRTASQEYEFYGALEQISRAAPDNFRRLHKSFCVNMNFVRAVNFTERTVTMADDSVLPFSRNVRAELKASYKR